MKTEMNESVHTFYHYIDALTLHNILTSRGEKVEIVKVPNGYQIRTIK